MLKGTRKVVFSFEESHLTHFGGMWLFQQFCQGLRLRYRLQRYVHGKHRAGDCRPADLFLALLFAMVMGLRRINKTEILQYKGALVDMLGLEKFPDQTVLRRFLKRLTPTDIRQLVRLHDSLRAWLFELPEARHSLILDIDSVVLVVYGHAQGARVGYNPKKRGRRSYHPLFCFESHWHEFWHGILRPGNAGAATGVVPFLEVCLAKVPGTVARERIRFRMDSGFFGKRVVEFLDQSGYGYVIVAKAYPTIKARALRTRFTALQDGWEYGQFYYRPGSWKHRHRFIVVRRPIPEDPEEAKSLTLFKDRRYVYHVFVSNLDLSTWRVYLFYNGRANIEKNNREFLYDYPLGQIPTRTWTANVAFFQLLLFAADLVHWFRRLCLPKSYSTATLDTIRTDFLLLPAKLVRRSKKNILKLPADYHHQREFLEAERAIAHLRLPEKFRFCK
jgi:Transposase DDE domain group 1